MLEKTKTDNKNGGFTANTELLTPSGWKTVSDITVDDTVIQWSLDGSMEFVNPVNVFSNVASDLLKISNQQGHINQEVPSNHRIVYEGKGEIKETRAHSIGNIQYKSTSNYINTGELITRGTGLTVRDRLLIAIQADGYFNSPDKRTGERIGLVPVSFTFAKKRKSDRLVELAVEAGLRLDDRKVDKRGRQNWALYLPSSDQILWPRNKRLSSITDLESVSHLWCKEFIDEVALWDGHIVKGNTDRITWRCIVKANAEYVQAVASLAGYRTHFSMRVDNRKATYSDIYNVQINKQLNVTSVQRIEPEKVISLKQIYGIQVPSGYLLTRNNGGVCVTGDAS